MNDYKLNKIEKMDRERKEWERLEWKRKDMERREKEKMEEEYCAYIVASELKLKKGLGFGMKRTRKKIKKWFATLFSSGRSLSIYLGRKSK
jgi:hypothetical protein